MHFDWGASQFLSKEVMVGLVGYVYKELGCDSGSGDRVGCFQSQVFGIGPQIGFLFPVGDMQGYLNFKAYGEFAAENRPSGWNTWVTFLSRRPRPERLRRQSRSSENISVKPSCHLRVLKNVARGDALLREMESATAGERAHRIGWRPPTEPKRYLDAGRGGR